VDTGIRWGSPDAPLTIVEFIDFQCPFCARWAARVDSLVALYPHEVQIVTHHFPISSHPFAIPAAIAVECADRQGAPRTFQTVLFRQQNVLGARKWEDFATIAGVQTSTSSHAASRYR
jgi:protein-disulfide isomerase